METKSAPINAADLHAFTRDELGAHGFSGWIPLIDLRTQECPDGGGVYVVIYLPDLPVTC
jgi:hypothetical protein